MEIGLWSWRRDLRHGLAAVLASGSILVTLWSVGIELPLPGIPGISDPSGTSIVQSSPFEDSPRGVSAGDRPAEPERFAGLRTPSFAQPLERSRQTIVRVGGETPTVLGPGQIEAPPTPPERVEPPSPSPPPVTPPPRTEVPPTPQLPAPSAPEPIVIEPTVPTVPTLEVPTLTVPELPALP